jgi:hypothetical protein
MKTKNYVLLVSFVFMTLIFASCGKDGATGPQGPIGPTGATGVAGTTGPTGPAGANGSVIYSGNTTPPAATGAVGDFYLDLATGILYGPKTASGWGSGFSLKGQTGAAGAAGNTIISGTGAPSATTGNTGDYYLDDSSYLLYGPKTASGWGTATSLQGPAGTANVQYSGWNFATNIRDTTIDESSLVVANLAASSITTSDLSNASIQVYLNFGAGVFPMPYTSDAGGKTSTMSFLPQVGRILITRYTADGTGSVSLSSVIQYRYVIIPGSVLVAVNNHINLKDYEAVRKYFRIPN